MLGVVMGHRPLEQETLLRAGCVSSRYPFSCSEKQISPLSMVQLRSRPFIPFLFFSYALSFRENKVTTNCTTVVLGAYQVQKPYRALRTSTVARRFSGRSSPSDPSFGTLSCPYFPLGGGPLAALQGSLTRGAGLPLGKSGVRKSPTLVQG